MGGEERADGDEGREDGEGVQGLDFGRPQLSAMGHPGGFKDPRRTGRPRRFFESVFLSKHSPLSAFGMQRQLWSPPLAKNAPPPTPGGCSEAFLEAGVGRQFCVRWCRSRMQALDLCCGVVTPGDLSLLGKCGDHSTGIRGPS